MKESRLTIDVCKYKKADVSKSSRILKEIWEKAVTNTKILRGAVVSRVYNSAPIIVNEHKLVLVNIVSANFDEDKKRRLIMADNVKACLVFDECIKEEEVIDRNKDYRDYSYKFGDKGCGPQNLMFLKVGKNKTVTIMGDGTSIAIGDTLISVDPLSSERFSDLRLIKE